MSFSERFTLKEIMDLNRYCEKYDMILMDETNRERAEYEDDYISKDIDIILPFSKTETFKTYETLESTVSLLNRFRLNGESKILKKLKIEWRIPTKDELNRILMFINPYNEREFNNGKKFYLWNYLIWSCTDSKKSGQKIALKRIIDSGGVAFFGRCAKTIEESLSAEKGYAFSIIVGKIIK